MGSPTQTLVFPLTNRSVRQIFDHETDTASYRLMYASGARIPVWYPDAELLLKAAHKRKGRDNRLWKRSREVISDHAPRLRPKGVSH